MSSLKYGGQVLGDVLGTRLPALKLHVTANRAQAWAMEKHCGILLKCYTAPKLMTDAPVAEAETRFASSWDYHPAPKWPLSLVGRCSADVATTVGEQEHCATQTAIDNLATLGRNIAAQLLARNQHNVEFRHFQATRRVSFRWARMGAFLNAVGHGGVGIDVLTTKLWNLSRTRASKDSLVYTLNGLSRHCPNIRITLAEEIKAYKERMEQKTHHYPHPR